MSCFEKSTFVKNHQVLNLDLLAAACESMGWKYIRQKNSLTVTEVGQGPSTGREPVLTVTGNQITWNSYYRRDGRRLSNDMQGRYQMIYNDFQIQYAFDAINKAFTSRGFTLIPDLAFQPGSEVKHRFTMKTRSKMKNETNPITKIKFEILSDGSVRTDSDYIPKDVHELADQAMDELAEWIGNPRSIAPKPIPAKYKDKAFCHPKNQISQNL